MKFDQIKELENEKFRRLTGVRKGTFSKMMHILRQADRVDETNIVLQKHIGSTKIRNLISEVVSENKLH